MKPYKTTCMIIFEADNGDLKDYPATEETSISFDATDLTLTGWIQQFRKVLSLAGFAEKSINDFLGEY